MVSTYAHASGTYQRPKGAFNASVHAHFTVCVNGNHGRVWNIARAIVCLHLTAIVLLRLRLAAIVLLHLHGCHHLPELIEHRNCCTPAVQNPKFPMPIIRLLS